MVYVSFTIFCVLNILTGVFVQNANALVAAEENEFTMAVPQADVQQETIDRLFDSIDDNMTGTITIEEFESICHHPDVHALLKDLGLDITPETARGFFLMLNFDHDGSLSKEEFSTGVSRVSGTAKSIDMAQLMSNYGKVLTMVEELERIDITRGATGSTAT